MSAPTPERGDVTMQDIADRCGVTRATVSLALNGRGRISERTTRRIREAAAELGYDPTTHQAARHLSLRRHGRRPLHRVIGVAAPRSMFQAAYFRRLLDGMWQSATSAGFGLLCSCLEDVNSLTDDPWDLQRARPLERGAVDALACLVHPQSYRELRRLREAHQRREVPMILLGHGVAETPSIGVDERASGLALGRALLDRGHQRMAFLAAHDLAEGPISAQTATSGQIPERLRGLGEAIREHGADPDDRIVPMPCPPGWMDPAKAAERLRAQTNDKDENAFAARLGSPGAPTVAVCGNDPIALRLWGALGRAGLRVPERVSIVGHDDTDPLPDGAGGNRLSSVALPLEQMGERAAERLLAQLNGDADAEPACERLPAPPVLRESVALCGG